jgi:hypothetical protein
MIRLMRCVHAWDELTNVQRVADAADRDRRAFLDDVEDGLFEHQRRLGFASQVMLICWFENFAKIFANFSELSSWACYLGWEDLCGRRARPSALQGARARRRDVGRAE